MKDAALTYRLVLKTTAFAPHLLKEHNYTNINIKNILAKPALDRLYCAVSITCVVFSFMRHLFILLSLFRLGFGSFVDKVVMPYVSTVPRKLVEPCEGCAAPYGFKHHMRLSTDTSGISTLCFYFQLFNASFFSWLVLKTSIPKIVFILF